jgi:hypothetical protein
LLYNIQVSDLADATQVRWFQRWLMHRRTVDTGPAFSWIADNESRYRSSLR